MLGSGGRALVCVQVWVHVFGRGGRALVLRASLGPCVGDADAVH